MPIEIRELIIKAFVGQDHKDKPKSKDCGDKKAQEAVQESIEQFAEILKQEKER
jgi:hypothetical protein